MDAFLLLVEKHKLVAENSGILSLAGLKKLNEKNKKVVSLISGGNIDVMTCLLYTSKWDCLWFLWCDLCIRFFSWWDIYEFIGTVFNCYLHQFTLYII